MKKGTITVLILSMAIFCAIFAQAENTVFDLPTSDNYLYIDSIAYADGSLYALSSNKIYRLNKGGDSFALYAETANEPANDSEKITQLYADGGQLYGFYEYGGKFGPINIKDSVIDENNFTELDMNSHLSAYEGFDGENYSIDPPIDTVFCGGKLFALYNDESGQTYKLSAFNVSTGEETAYDIENLKGFSKYKDSELLIIQSEGKNTQLSSFDALTGKTKLIGSLNIKNNGFQAPVVFYDPYADNIMYISDDSVFVYSADDKNTKCGFIPSGVAPNKSSNVIALPENRFAAANMASVYVLSTGEDALSNKELNICGDYFGDTHDKAVKRMLDVKVTGNSDFLDAKQLAEKLLVKTSNIDVMFINADSIDIARLYKKGYAYDLSNIEGVKDYYRSIYPYLQNFGDEGSGIYALPVNIQPQNCSQNLELMEKLSITPPETFSDFCKILKWWYENSDLTEEYNFFENPNVQSSAWDVLFLTYEYYLSSTNSKIRFNTPEFKAMAQQLIDTLPVVPPLQDDLNMDDEMDYYDTPTLFGESGLYIENIAGYHKQKAVKDALMSQSDYKEEDFNIHPYAVYPMFLSVNEKSQKGPLVGAKAIVINSEGKNLEEAKTYVKNYIKYLGDNEKLNLQPDYDTLQADPFYNDNVNNIKLTIKELENMLPTLEGAEKTETEKNLLLAKQDYENLLSEHGKFLYTAENLAEYKGYLSNAAVKSHILSAVDSQEEFQNLKSRFTDGQIGLDQFVKEMDSKIELLELESK